MTAAQILTITLSYIRTHGWTRGPGERGKARDLLMSMPVTNMQALALLRKAIDPDAQWVSLVEWNDQPGREMHEVEAVLEKAIELADMEFAA